MEKPPPSTPRPEDEVGSTEGTSSSRDLAVIPFTPSTLSPKRFWVLSLGICLGLFLSILDTSIVATSLYDIGIDFEDVQSINWVALAYTLADVAFAVTFARLSDIIGRRKAYVTASVIFFAFSLGCGFAQNLRQLIAFRTLQGIGGAGLYSLSIIILPEVCPDQYRQFIGALIGIVVAGSGVLGPVLGGIFTHYATWRWVFWINGPISVISLAIFLLAWPRKDQLRAVERRSWKELDYLGSLLVIIAAVLVVFAFQNAGEASGKAWNKAIFIAPLVVGILGWVALIAWEYTVERKLSHRLAPAFPFSLFCNRVYTVGAISTLLLGFPYLLLIYSFPIRAQIVSGQSALMAGVWLLPMLGSSAVGTIVCGKLNSVKNYLFETLLAGATLMTLSCGLLATVWGSGDDKKALGFLVFAGLGFGFATASSVMLVSFEAPIRDYAPAQGIVSQLRILGGSLGISMSTALVSKEITKYLPGLTEEERATLGGHETQLSSAEHQALQAAYSHAFHDGMVAAAVVSGAAALLMFGAYRRGPRKLVMEMRAALFQQETERRQRQAAQSRAEAHGALSHHADDVVSRKESLAA